MAPPDLKTLLDKKLKLYNHPSFIEHDPVSIPHMFTKRQDIEIMGFFAAVFAWGQRITIINKCKDLARRMDGKPYDFIIHHSEKDLKALTGFAHRTFNDTDLLYFIAFFHHWYKKHKTLEDAFSEFITSSNVNVEPALNGFRKEFFREGIIHGEPAPRRTMKHVPSPSMNSACKRINMFLRWMVRSDKNGVDFGIWKKISPKQLICPLDLHVHRVALSLGLMERKISDWKAAVELTENLKRLDPKDPVKYDLALFGMGAME